MPRVGPQALAVPAGRFDAAAAPSFARRFWPVFALALVGVLALAVQLPDRTGPGVPAELRELPAPVFALAWLANPLLLALVAALLGAGLAHRAGLRSRLAGTMASPWGDGRALVATLAFAAACGFLLGLGIQAVDAALAPAIGGQWQALRAQAESRAGAAALALGVLYGGLTEEVMMRWGLMSLVAWLSLVLAARAGSPRAAAVAPAPRAAIAWFAIVVAALAFGFGHLPSLAQQIDIGAALFARTVALNALAGVVYGWLFWRRGLEAAMAAHAASHLGFALVRAIVH